MSINCNGVVAVGHIRDLLAIFDFAFQRPQNAQCHKRPRSPHSCAPGAQVPKFAQAMQLPLMS